MKEMKKVTNKSIIIDCLIVIIFSVIFYGCIIYRNGIMYSMNDDIAMRSISSGIYSGIASPNMIFSVFPYSIVLVLLNKITVKIDWYGVILILSMMVFFSYTLYNIIKNKKEIFEKVIYIALGFFGLTLLFPGFLVEITFTSVSIFIATCCLILYLLPNNKLKNLIMIIGIILSFGIRPKSSLMILVFFVPAWIYINRGNKDNLKKDFILGIKIFISLLICIVVEKLIIMDTGWKEYLGYNEYRSLFYDYYYETVLELPEEERVEIFHNAGFNDDEMTLLCSYGPIGFRPEIRTKMGMLIREIESHGIKTNSNIKLTVSNLFKIKSAQYYIFTLVVMCYFVLRASNRKEKILTILPFLCVQFLILAYLIVQGRLPDRVVMPLFFSYIIMNLAIILKEEEPKRLLKNFLHYDKILITVVSIVLFAVSTGNIKINEFEKDKCERENEILEYFEEHQDNFYIYDRNSLETFNLITQYRAKNYINMSGWTVFSPLHTAKIESQGVSSLKELLFKDNVYLVIDLSDIDEFARRYIDKDAKIEQIDELNGTYIYKVTK